MKKSYPFAYFIILFYPFVFFYLCLYMLTRKSGYLTGRPFMCLLIHIFTVATVNTPFLLTVTLSIRNIDPNHQIKITIVDYYETQGKGGGPQKLDKVLSYMSDS